MIYKYEIWNRNLIQITAVIRVQQYEFLVLGWWTVLTLLLSRYFSWKLLSWSKPVNCLFWLSTQMFTRGHFWLVFTVILTILNNTRQSFYQSKTVNSLLPVNVLMHVCVCVHVCACVYVQCLKIHFKQIWSWNQSVCFLNSFVYIYIGCLKNTHLEKMY